MLAPLLVPVLLGTAATIAETPLTCQVTPRVIEMDAFYTGANVKVEGMAAPGSKIVVLVTGSESEESFNRKARFGPVWINSGKVRISGVPRLFLRFSPEPVANLLSRETIGGHLLDPTSVMARMCIQPAPPAAADDAAIRRDYLALKQSRGTYTLGDRSVTMGSDADCAWYRLEFHWPKKAPPATYRVHVFEVRNGSIGRQISVPLAVAPAGLPARIANLAEDHAASYGIAAVLIGVLAGFGIDLLATRVFRRKRVVAH